ncbi:MAG: tetratricopeptide repeat protein [Acidobacteriota bacterium]|nr:tetratricopeptide repeat protein [Acidobacteriota bacterium]MDH3523572.1 tetratricopeptide repeat protein [Acidobacteriota bacterium]
MGLFGRNWAKELDRAEDLLGRDLAVPALEIAERAARQAAGELRARAAALVARARRAALASVLAKADAAEAAGDLDDAADWLLSAVEREPSALRRAELEARRRSLLGRGEDAGSSWSVRAETITVVAGETADEPDVSFRYETLVSMLADELRGRYEDRPAAFQEAVVALNEGEAGAALAALEELAAAAPDDPVLRLERGRARLLSGEAAAARGDLAAAWDALGAEPLDAGGTLLAPALWAEASLAAGDSEEVLQRLAALASPATGHPELCRLYGAALLAAGRPARAVDHLDAVLALVPGDPELNLLMAEALVAAGEPARALTGLESAVAPSCAGGSCARPAAHLPSFRLLARLHLAPGGDPERARELLAHVANAQQGQLGAEDLLILAAYYEATGDGAAAADAAAEAARLASAGESPGEVQASPAPPRGRIL